MTTTSGRAFLMSLALVAGLVAFVGRSAGREVRVLCGAFAAAVVVWLAAEIRETARGEW